MVLTRTDPARRDGSTRGVTGGLRDRRPGAGHGFRLPVRRFGMGFGAKHPADLWPSSLSVESKD